MFKSMLLSLLLVVSLNAKAYTIGPDDIGGLDTFIASAGVQGNTDAEALWVQGVLGDPTVDWTVKIANVGYSQTIEDATVWGFELVLSPEYFIIKNSNMVALFANVVSTDWGVFQQAVLPGGLNIPTDPFSISHVTSLDSSGDGSTRDNPVPEAPAFLMIGLGVLGLAGISRKYSS